MIMIDQFSPQNKEVEIQTEGLVLFTAALNKMNIFRAFLKVYMPIY